MSEEKVPLFAYNTDTQKFWILGKVVDITKAEEVDKCIRTIKQENEQLKDLIIEKNKQIEDIRNQKKDYTEINILTMKLNQKEKIINNLNELINEYENNRNSFKWNEQDYIDVIDKIKEIIGVMSNV